MRSSIYRLGKLTPQPINKLLLLQEIESISSVYLMLLEKPV